MSRAVFKAKVDGVTAGGRVTIEIDGRLTRSPYSTAGLTDAMVREDPKSVTGGQVVDFYVHDVKEWATLIGEEFVLTLERKS